MAESPSSGQVSGLVLGAEQHVSGPVPLAETEGDGTTATPDGKQVQLPDDANGGVVEVPKEVEGEQVESRGDSSDVEEEQVRPGCPK